MHDLPLVFSPAYVYCHAFLRQRAIDIDLESIYLHQIIECKSLTNQSSSARLKVFHGDNVELRIETHNEFVCYIWILAEVDTDLDVFTYINDVPYNWMNNFPGNLLTQSLLSFEQGNVENPPFTKLKNLFGENQLVGNFVENESARIWSDFYATSDNPIFRVHIDDFSLGPKRRGRLAQRILELENYRSLSEIAFPIAEEIVFEL